MKERWVISDTHFGHANMMKFLREDGSPVREFESVEAMNEHMVDKWNSIVHPHHTVYHLGDVVINRKFLPIVERLNGRKILVKGNHDIFKLNDYTAPGRFVDIRACVVHKFKKDAGRMILTHIPIHDETMDRMKVNVHGHVHTNSLKDERFINACVEMNDYTPIHYDQLEEKVKKLL